MKIKTAILMVLAVLLFSGCVGMLGEAGMKWGLDKSEVRRPVKEKKIFYKLAYYKHGYTRWTIVGNEPDSQPNDNLLYFGEKFIAELKEGANKRGYELIKIDESSFLTNRYIEIRVACIFVLNVPTCGTKWYIEQQEVLYRWDFGYDFGKEGLNGAAKNIALLSIRDYLKFIEEARF